jgi:hypothetical protein
MKQRRNTLYPLKLALSSLTGGDRSIGIVRLRTKTTEFYETKGFIWKLLSLQVLEKWCFIFDTITSKLGYFDVRAISILSVGPNRFLCFVVMFIKVENPCSLSLLSPHYTKNFIFTPLGVIYPGSPTPALQAWMHNVIIGFTAIATQHIVT